ncbi:DUF1003 domain-containing protein [Roseomonas marmotae]|uniref:DUF1003 domain-containing protein n=1 Tax=Roseomonas marmotae TaxID=2768161 RepID=A0ABS3K9Z1_9PROT|nr:DUF1003 domain-containing protein [Roseomonas marmotae]MBO1074265.1 DUF1003 domain-containing protein [Roseomonas marmotae]QTI78019.1 DUF1003 domain-containing protein [Roseomonas marmotae]
MDQDVDHLAKQLLENGFDRFSPRERRVLMRIAKRHPTTRSVNHAMAEQDSLGDRIADRVARFGGSWAFIISFMVVMIFWVLSNSFLLARYNTAYDPYPFIFLNLVLSMVAALQAPLIMMSQNRQAQRDRVAAALDYEVNLKAELEIMALHDKLDQLRLNQLRDMLTAQQRQLQRLTERICPEGP